MLMQSVQNENISKKHSLVLFFLGWLGLWVFALIFAILIPILVPFFLTQRRFYISRQSIFFPNH